VVEPQPTAAAPSHIQLVPFHADRDMTIEALSVGLLPWGTAKLFGVRGKSPEGEPLIAVVQEWPLPSNAGAVAVDQPTIERWHLDQFCTDFALAHGSLPYEDVTVGSNPPDFTARLPTGQHIGVDCTQFTIQKQRHAAALFERIRRALLAEPRSRFLQLSGMVIYMWFRGADKRPALPPKESEAAAVEAIISALADYVPDVKAGEVEGTEPPEQAPDLGIADTDFGCSFYAVPMRGAAPTGVFFGATGFEIALAYQTAGSRKQALADLTRLIADHDKEGVNELLVTASAPNKGGAAFLSDAFMLDFLLEESFDIPSPAYVGRVIAYFWGQGRAVELYPARTVITPNVYAGYVPPHFTAQPPAVTVVAEDGTTGGQTDGPNASETATT
jgi:hypothetical protein